MAPGHGHPRGPGSLTFSEDDPSEVSSPSLSSSQGLRFRGFLFLLLLLPRSGPWRSLSERLPSAPVVTHTHTHTHVRTEKRRVRTEKRTKINRLSSKSTDCFFLLISEVVQFIKTNVILITHKAKLHYHVGLLRGLRQWLSDWFEHCAKFL